jgi:hypothetical protein
VRQKFFGTQARSQGNGASSLQKRSSVHSPS